MRYDARKRLGRTIVPNVRCLGCGGDIGLDAATYVNFAGDVACEHCQRIQWVRILNGELQSTEKPRVSDVADALFHLPPEVTGVWEDSFEAEKALHLKLFKSCAVMCRRALQGALLARDIADDKLSKMILAASNQNPPILNQRLKQIATAVTFFGNSGAHPLDEELRKVEELDATLGLQVAKEIILALYPKEEDSA